MSEDKNDEVSDCIEKTAKQLFSFAQERNMTKKQYAELQEWYVREFWFSEDKKPAYIKHLYQLGTLLLGFNTREEAEDFVVNRVEEAEDFVLKRVEEGLNIPIIEQDGFFFVELDYSNET